MFVRTRALSDDRKTIQIRNFDKERHEFEDRYNLKIQ